MRLSCNLSSFFAVANISELNPTPDPHRQEDSVSAEHVEEIDKVDGETIVSFASIEEMKEFVARGESGRSKKTNDLSQIKSWKSKLQQLTPLLPSTSSATTSILTRPKNLTPSISAAPSTSKVFSASCDAPGTSMGSTEQEKVISQEELEQAKDNLGSETIISAEFTNYAFSTVSVPPLGRTRQATKNLNAIPKESTRRTNSTSRKPRKSKKLISTVPTAPKVNVDAALGDPVEDIVVYEGENQEQCGKLTTISICNYI